MESGSKGCGKPSRREDSEARGAEGRVLFRSLLRQSVVHSSIENFDVTRSLNNNNDRARRPRARTSSLFSPGPSGQSRARTSMLVVTALFWVVAFGIMAHFLMNEVKDLRRVVREKARLDARRVNGVDVRLVTPPRPWRSRLTSPAPLPFPTPTLSPLSRRNAGRAVSARWRAGVCARTRPGGATTTGPARTRGTRRCPRRRFDRRTFRTAGADASLAAGTLRSRDRANDRRGAGKPS